MKSLNNENFEETVNGLSQLFVVKFYSDTCAPCRIYAPVVDMLEKNNPTVSFFDINTSESPELASKFGVRGVPFTVFCEKREVLYSKVGVTPLGQLQYIIDNIDDEYFRENGEFRPAPKKDDWTFRILIIAIVALFLGLFVFL